MELGGLWWTNVLNLALPPQSTGLSPGWSTKTLVAIWLASPSCNPGLHLNFYSCGRHLTFEKAEGFKVRRTGWSDASVTCWLWNPGTAQISPSLFLTNINGSLEEVDSNPHGWLWGVQDFSGGSTSIQPQGCSNVIRVLPVPHGWCTSSPVSGPQVTWKVYFLIEGELWVSIPPENSARQNKFGLETKTSTFSLKVITPGICYWGYKHSL